MSITQNPLITFQQFGYKELSRTGNGHSKGNCIFCGKEDHFFINILSPNKVWDCKRCGKGGGFQKFLQMVVDTARINVNFEPLSKNRHLSIDTLKFFDVGFINDTHVLPVYSWDKKQILNIKIYDGDSFKNTAGCTAAMYGLWTLPRKDTEYDTIYVAEGEWDAISLQEMILLTKEKRSAIIGVPGAGTFKPESVQYFIGKRVYLLYDNDLAGQNGIKKATAMLSQVASAIDVIKWPEGTPEGYDVRDVYTKQFKKTPLPAMLWLKSNCESLNLAAQDSVDTTEITSAPIPIKEFYSVWQKWIHLEDNKSKDQRGTDIYDVVFGTILANRIPGSPVWMYIVAPPGGFKTEPLLACAGGKLIEMVESVTAPALISGMNVGGHSDPSLIARINMKTLIVKDWTILLGLPDHELSEIMSILRGAFDGVCGRNFGNGVRREIKSTFGILAAVTPVIEQYIEQTSAVGERFISWRNWLSEDQEVRKKHIRRALANTMNEVEMKAELNTITRKVLLAKYPEPPKPSDEQTEQIISMSEWVAVMRGLVTRDKYSKSITHRPCTELGTRLSKEILKWLMGVSLFKGDKVITRDSIRIVEAIARSSVSSRNLAIVSFLWKEVERGFSRKEISDAIKLPDDTTEILLGNLTALKVLSKEIHNNATSWKLRASFIKLTKEASVL